MTPKEKARELVDIYLDTTKRSLDDKGFFYDIDLAKECALILVNELIKETGSKYWYDVKQEIEKL
jgi:hypothetical protein